MMPLKESFDALVQHRVNQPIKYYVNVSETLLKSLHLPTLLCLIVGRASIIRGGLVKFV